MWCYDAAAVCHCHVTWSIRNPLRQVNVRVSRNQPVCLTKWSHASLPVCLFSSQPSLPMLPVCDLSPSPTQSHVHFLWGQRPVPESRWLRGFGPVLGLRHTEPPWRPMSWRLWHQRDGGSGGRAEPGLTLPCPLHHNVGVRSHSLALTFPVICTYQWRPASLSNSLMCVSHCSHSELPDSCNRIHFGYEIWPWWRHWYFLLLMKSRKETINIK